MKNYFIQLFNYDQHVNLLMAELMSKAGNPETPVRLMAHLLTAQQIWLARCKGEPTVGIVLWPDGPPETFEKTINDNHREWLDFLESLSPADFDKNITYKNLVGDSFENKLSDILAHAINHGTHHRAQIGQHLKSTGIDLPFTDYIFYVRELNK